MTTRTNPHPTSQRRAFGSVIAVVLLAIGAIVIVGLATPGADRAAQNADAVDSIRAALSADAGVSITAAAITVGADPALPPQFASDYDIEFQSEVEDDVQTITVTARHADATRVIQVQFESL